jgi:hypothetical protein
MDYTDFKVNRRLWHRESVKIPAQYFIKGQSTKYLDCTIINLSRSGVAVLFPENSPFELKALIYLDIIVPKTFEQFTLRGKVKNKHKKENGFIGGIHFESLLPDDMFGKLTRG